MSKPAEVAFRRFHCPLCWAGAGQTKARCPGLGGKAVGLAYQGFVVDLLAYELVLTQGVAGLPRDGIDGPLLHLLFDGAEEREEGLPGTLLARTTMLGGRWTTSEQGPASHGLSLSQGLLSAPLVRFPPPIPTCCTLGFSILTFRGMSLWAPLPTLSSPICPVLPPSCSSSSLPASHPLSSSLPHPTPPTFSQPYLEAEVSPQCCDLLSKQANNWMSGSSSKSQVHRHLSAGTAAALSAWDPSGPQPVWGWKRQEGEEEGKQGSRSELVLAEWPLRVLSEAHLCSPQRKQPTGPIPGAGTDCEAVSDMSGAHSLSDEGNWVSLGYSQPGPGGG